MLSCDTSTTMKFRQLQFDISLRWSKQDTRQKKQANSIINIQSENKKINKSTGHWKWPLLTFIEVNNSNNCEVSESHFQCVVEIYISFFFPSCGGILILFIKKTNKNI